MTESQALAAYDRAFNAEERAKKAWTKRPNGSRLARYRLAMDATDRAWRHLADVRQGRVTG